jgi:hypothetical protein
MSIRNSLLEPGVLSFVVTITIVLTAAFFRQPLPKSLRSVVPVTVTISYWEYLLVYTLSIHRLPRNSLRSIQPRLPAELQLMVLRYNLVRPMSIDAGLAQPTPEHLTQALDSSTQPVAPPTTA